MLLNFRLFIKKYGLSGLQTFIRLKLGLTNRIKLRGVRGTFTLRPSSSDIAVFKHIFLRDDYDLKLNFEPQTIVDAGANVGLASIFFANRYPKAKILAIELSPSNYEYLKINTSSFSLITTSNAGIWNKQESLFIDESMYAHWGQRIGDNEKSITSVEVPSLTVDELIERYSMPVIDLFKIDIEGAEDELFSSNYENWLPRVRAIIIEFHDRIKEGSSVRIKQLLKDYSFAEVDSVGENSVFINTSFETDA